MLKTKPIKSICTAAVFSLAIGTQAASQDYAQEAYDILGRNCVGCHNHTIQMLESRAKSPPDRINTLLQRITTDNPNIRMPKNREPLNQEQIQIIFDWVYDGAPDPDSNEELRTNLEPISPQTRTELIKAHLNSPKEFRREKAVYFVIADPQDSKDHLGALSKLINSLSWKTDLVIPEPVAGSNNTIFFVDRSKLGWSDEVWEMVMDKDPYDLDPEVSILFTDWFITNASSGKHLYHDILYPDIMNEQQLVFNKLSRKKTDNSFGGSPIEAGDQPIHASARSHYGDILYQAAGFEESGVAKYNRIVDRIPFKYGNLDRIYWKSYDFASEDDLGDIFTADEDFQHAGNEMIFELPNGLHAFFITDRIGRRLEAAPTNIVFDRNNQSEIINGVSCMSCHASGIIDTFANEIEGLTPNTIGQDQIDEDNDNYRNVLESIGVEVGDDSIVQIYNNYEDGRISREKAASIFGLTENQYSVRIQEIFPEDERAVRKLISDRGITWSDFEDEFHRISNGLDSAPAAPSINSVNYANKKITSWAKIKSN